MREKSTPRNRNAQTTRREGMLSSSVVDIALNIATKCSYGGNKDTVIFLLQYPSSGKSHL